jgi:ketosteroid isomerase-like protein
MTSANLDLVRSIYAALARGDFSTTDWAHPEIEWVVADGPEPGSGKGVATWLAFQRDYLDLWENYRIEADEYREIDDERVLVLLHSSGRAKTSGLELGKWGSRGANLVQIRSGKVTRTVIYWDRDRALADLGLAPEGDPSHS